MKSRLARRAPPLVVGLTLAALVLTPEAARASSFTINVILRADALGEPAFGITSLPAGPFFGSFTFNGTLLPNQQLAQLDATALSVQIGDFTSHSTRRQATHSEFQLTAPACPLSSTFSS